MFEATVNANGVHEFEVIVGNIGTVYYGTLADLAAETFNAYADMSAQGNGRYAYERVTLLTDGEITHEYDGRRTFTVEVKEKLPDGRQVFIDSFDFSCENSRVDFADAMRAETKDLAEDIAAFIDNMEN